MKIEELRLSLEKMDSDIQNSNCATNSTQILMNLAKEKFQKNEALRELLSVEQKIEKNLQRL